MTPNDYCAMILAGIQAETRSIHALACGVPCGSDCLRCRRVRASGENAMSTQTVPDIAVIEQAWQKQL